MELPSTTLYCVLCHKPVAIESAKSDANGQVVHPECYTRNVVTSNLPQSFLPDIPNSRIGMSGGYCAEWRKRWTLANNSLDYVAKFCVFVVSHTFVVFGYWSSVWEKRRRAL
jgi:hypothetical protein